MFNVMSDFNFKDTLNNYKDVFFKSKRYWIIYLIFIAATFFTTLNRENIAHPKFELITFALMAVLGVFCILYYFLHNSDKELYKVAFVSILIFGIICSFAVPIVFHADEIEHFTRSEITSQGVIVPDWIGDEWGIDRLYNHTEGNISHEYNRGVGFRTIGSLTLFNENSGKTVFTSDDDTQKIDYTPYIRGSAFEQNPFYGYLPQAVGMAIAKLLDLNVIWLLWLGRVFNLVFYACLIALAIRITPTLKMPLMIVSCIPVTIFHASSVSIDAMIFGLGILIVAYFLYLHQSGENTIENRHLIIFTILCLLCGLCKLPYLAFIFLLLLIPRENFKNDNILPFVLLSILIVSICGLLWSSYSTHALQHSWRSLFNHVNSTQQLNNLLSNPSEIFRFLQYTMGEGTSKILPELVNFDYGNPNSPSRFAFIIMACEAFLAIALSTYPNKVKFDLKTKFGALAIFLIVYVGTFFVQLLTWANVGELNVGVHIRYFIPLFCLIPIICQFNSSNDEKGAYEKYAFVFIIGFMATLVLSIATTFY